jgi:hypothetical protein
MALIAPERNPSLYLLRDHLEATLALGEDLLSTELHVAAGDRPGLRNWIRQTRDLEEFLGSLRTLEYAMTARLLQARKWAEELRRGDVRLKPLIALFVAGTAPLLDAAAELGDTDTRDFECDDAALTFLRRRGMLAPDAAGLELISRLAVGEDYQVVGRIGLGPLLDLVATFLDTLDTLYGPDIAPIEEVQVLSGRTRDTAARHPMEPGAVN